MKPASSSKDQDLLKLLKELESIQAEYPVELQSTRRDAFLEQLGQYRAVESGEEYSPADQKVIGLLSRLRAIRAKYPPHLLAARRSTFQRQIVWMTLMSFWYVLYSAVQKRISAVLAGPWRTPVMKVAPASLILVGIATAAALGFLFYGNHEPLMAGQARPQQGTFGSGQMLAADQREVRILCKPGYLPPLCLAGEFNRKQDLSFQGNGTARPAVAKDTLPEDGHIHRASNVNDGLYGPGASWRSNSSNSWIKIDLGKATEVNTVEFGKDRLGKIKGGDPGQFVISVALADNVYANGNSTNDNQEYSPVYRSDQTGFSGAISGPETISAQFDTHLARYIKITFQNKGTAVDEVEAFMVQPPIVSSLASATPRTKPSGAGPNSTLAVSSATNPPITATFVPPDTATVVPTTTQVPTDTVTAVPTATIIPTSTFVPTSTLVPTITLTSVPTSVSLPTNTPVPQPTNTPVPPNTATPVPTDPATQPAMPTTSSYYNSLTHVPTP